MARTTATPAKKAERRFENTVYLASSATVLAFLIFFIVETIRREKKSREARIRESGIPGKPKPKHWLLHYPLLSIEIFSILYQVVTLVHAIIILSDINFWDSGYPPHQAFLFVETFIIILIRMSIYYYYMFRVYLVFRRTKYEIPKSYVRIFQATSVIGVIVIIGIFPYRRTNGYYLGPLFIVGVCVDTLIQGFLFTLFMRRLIQTAAIRAIHREDDDPATSDDRAIQVATRSFILLIVGFVFTLLFWIVLTRAAGLYLPSVEILVQVFLVFLSLSVWSDVYEYICCCFDVGCRRFFGRMAENECCNPARHTVPQQQLESV